MSVSKRKCIFHKQCPGFDSGLCEYHGLYYSYIVDELRKCFKQQLKEKHKWR